jgi:hypothetical protein
MRDQHRHAVASEVGKAVEDFELGARVECGSGFVKNQQLRIAHIGAGERELLPFAAGEIDAAFESATEHLLEAVIHMTPCARLMRAAAWMRSASPSSSTLPKPMFSRAVAS